MELPPEIQAQVYRPADGEAYGLNVDFQKAETFGEDDEGVSED